MSIPKYIAADAYARSIHDVDLAAHLATGRPVTVRHIAVEDPHSTITSWAWPVRLFEIAGGNGDGLSTGTFRVIEEHPSHLILGPHGEDVANVLEQRITPQLLAGTLTTRRQCLELILSMRQKGLGTALATIEYTCRGWSPWARDAMLAALGLSTATLSQAAPEHPLAVPA